MQSLLNCTSDSWDIHDIIRNQDLFVRFQTIISLSRKMVIGIEGLTYSINKATNEFIPPLALFNAAQDEGVTLQLDRVCREKVIEAFSHIYHQDDHKLLFVNMEASILDSAEGSNYLINQVKSYHINPRNIVIEINEARVEDISAIKRFSDTYRNLGFMVALDDVGTGFSNMDRISLVKPDIIKIDISLVKNIQQDYYKQEIIKSLISLSNMIGALVIAEGVETQDEAIQILKMGGHMMQGFFFGKPQNTYEDADVFSNTKIELLHKSFNQYMRAKINEERKNHKQLNRIIQKCVKELTSVPSHEFNNKLMQITWSYKNIECSYILDHSGIQVSNTIRYCDENEVKDNLIFYSAMCGADHTMEKYYYPLISARLSKYITDPYVSMATGNLCITASKVFTGVDHKKYILCIDFNTNVFDLESMKEITMSNLVFNINGKSMNELNQMINRMNEEIIKDSLTNSYNRRYMEERLLVDIFNASNAKQPISIILADIDFFKNVNDTFGHLAGDHVLKEFVKIAQRKIRKSTDWIARYGGEEFLIVLLNADANAAYKVAENIRQAIEEAEIPYNEDIIRITASFGTYTLTDAHMTYEQLMDLADKNLYLAKNNGRNQTISKI